MVRIRTENGRTRRRLWASEVACALSWQGKEKDKEKKDKDKDKDKVRVSFRGWETPQDSWGQGKTGAISLGTRLAEPSFNFRNRELAI